MIASKTEQPTPPPTAEVLGIPLAISDYDHVLAWMEATVSSGSQASLTAAAVNLVMCATDDPQVRAATLDCTLAVPDGQPLVWALRALGHRTASRIYGPDLMIRFCARAAAAGIPIFLYGGRDQTSLRLLHDRLTDRFPGLPIAGGYSPPFRPLDEQERLDVAHRIDASKAKVVWVGTGQPKQELWMARMRPLLQAPLLVGVGAAFDFHAGLVAQAPPLLQRSGLEWLFRLSREPRRLWRRYATQNPRFLVAFGRQLLAARAGGHRPSSANPPPR